MFWCTVHNFAGFEHDGMETFSISKMHIRNITFKDDFLYSWQVNPQLLYICLIYPQITVCLYEVLFLIRDFTDWQLVRRR